MEHTLFSDRSIWTMIHGIGLGGGALLGLSAALFSLVVAPRGAGGDIVAMDQSRQLTRLLVLVAALLWLTTIVGTYITFPPYRATPPEGLLDLSRYPRALIRATPGADWLHSFAMETKEHVPWIAAMVATAVAYIAARYRARLLTDPALRHMATALLAICFVLVGYVALLGTFVNKVAPLE